MPQPFASYHDVLTANSSPSYSCGCLMPSQRSLKEILEDTVSQLGPPRPVEPPTLEHFRINIESALKLFLECQVAVRHDGTRYRLVPDDAR